MCYSQVIDQTAAINEDGGSNRRARATQNTYSCTPTLRCMMYAHMLNCPCHCVQHWSYYRFAYRPLLQCFLQVVLFLIAITAHTLMCSEVMMWKNACLDAEGWLPILLIIVNSITWTISVQTHIRNPRESCILICLWLEFPLSLSSFSNLCLQNMGNGPLADVLGWGFALCLPSVSFPLQYLQHTHTHRDNPPFNRPCESASTIQPNLRAANCDESSHQHLLPPAKTLVCSPISAPDISIKWCPCSISTHLPLWARSCPRIRRQWLHCRGAPTLTPSPTRCIPHQWPPASQGLPLIPKRLLRKRSCGKNHKQFRRNRKPKSHLDAGSWCPGSKEEYTSDLESMVVLLQTAPVWTTYFSSSIGIPGIGVTSEPVAMRIFLVGILVVPPSSNDTSTVLGSIIFPQPWE